MKNILVAVFSVVANALFASHYLWVGGATGNWADAANWTDSAGVSVGTIPVAGDIAEFAATVEISDALEIGAGTLVITNAAGTGLHFKNTISGDGGIFKGGDGELHLHCSNAFKGGLVSCGTGKFKDKLGDTASSCVYAYADNAFGTGAVTMDPWEIINNYRGHGARLYFSGKQQSSITVPNEITLSADGESKSNIWLVDGCEELTFKEQVKSPFRVSVSCAAADNKVFFEKGYTATNYNMFNRGEIHFKGPVNSTLYPYSPVVIHLYSTENDYSYFHIGGMVYLHGENVLSQSGSRLEFSYAGSVIDLCGYSQTITGMTAEFAQGSSTCTFGFTSSGETPAMLHLTESVPSQTHFRGLFSGLAGLEWAPTDGSKEFCFSNTVQTTAGEFMVSSGIMRFRDGAGFDRLSKMTVKAGARLVIESTAGGLNTDELIVEDGGVLELGEGVTLQCSKLTAAGTEYGSNGFYDASDMPDTVVGAGRIQKTAFRNLWTGGNGDWNDPENWSRGKVPGEGESASITVPVTATVSVSTARLGVLNLSGAAMLVFSNGWNNCIRADEINIAEATVTVAGPFTNDTGKCRVYFECINFSLGEQSVIDVDGKGWRGGGYIPDRSFTNPTSRYRNHNGVEGGGFGPGCAEVQRGASHFGYGAPILDRTRVYSKLSPLYDDPYAPTEPGSGGMGLAGSAYGAVFEKASVPSGGGAVLIDASGVVSIRGRITACGVGAYINHWYYCQNQNNGNSGGSGGSVRILCGKITGDGEILADGGNGGFSKPYYLLPGMGDKHNSGGAAGGGGGIAICYDASQQASGDVSGMKISAAAGYYPPMPKTNAQDYQTEFLPYAKMDKYRRDAEPGTLYFTDDKIIDDTIGKGLNGKLFNVADYTYDGDLEWSYGNVRFGATGSVFTVTGDLTVTGEWSRIDIGGITKSTDRGTRPFVSSGTEPVAMNVGGNLVISNGAALAVYSAEVAGETAFGAAVDVSGEFIVGCGGTVLPTSDSYAGGAPGFSAGSFTLLQGGRINADHRGYCGSCNTLDYPDSGYHAIERIHGRGPGAGKFTGGGAGHGGSGGIGTLATSVTLAGGVYDDPYQPVRSGSGGGSGGYSFGGAGGGVFHLVSSGPVRLEGYISADGAFPEYAITNNNGWAYAGSGSGGTVNISGSSVTATSTARISARGGDAPMYRSMQISPGAGGGGRVSIWTGADVRERIAKPRRLRSSDPASPVFDGTLVWNGTVDIGGGTNVFLKTLVDADPVPSCFGSEGTVWFNRYAPQPLSLIFR